MSGSGLTPRTIQPIVLPGGGEVTFHEVVSDAKGYGLTMRFRFLAPWLPEALKTRDYEEIEADMAYLCETYALPRVANTGPQPSLLVVSLAERAVPFGDARPDVAQIYEAYRPEGGTCIWEGF